MKKNIYNFIFGVVFLIASINQANSQNYLNVNNKKDIPFGPAPCGSVVLFPIYFGFQEVSTTFLDIVTVTNAQEPVMRHGNGAWTPNNNGIGSFGNFMSFFEESQHLPNNILVYGNVLVNLRTGVSKKDYVIARNNGLQVHWNTNDSITVVKQLITGSSPTRIETGIFNWEDNSEDVAILDGSNIKIFRNQSDGYLNTSPSSFSVQAKKFKLRQLNEKTEGYVPSNSNDRDDLAVLDIIFGSGTISIFLNDNNNGFNFASPFAEIHPNKAIYDFEIADMDNDGFNDIIIAGVDDPANPTSFYVSVYKNYQGVLIGSTPI